ncbi:PecA family PE domain-processing aspartic protease [Mycobacterium heidelbergense]|uniref:Uncharacterized protein n=1 Tax=Mycobacterium heidelbergense TaxID=53376 RepID=A0A1X0DUW0_MYCHE|nr:PecA family PE domain-processing aspartic protease [Mycobacterium heidelbergense]MCV7049922.1 PecA family PE domain-processing aspartic protease [Mycobacterium heidelbergense]ORA76029.1 hypothetical protein BST25_03390 [Mycobacterium heidelbergense]BBZ52399.1 hypothetical protein MHEI_41160 [Mycobacterium heidelbergense]
MSFLTSPPEIISSLLFSGAGSAPMLAAAASWDGLATELGTAAQSFSSVTSGLTGQAWQGPASAAMTQTAARYAGYLTEAATQAQTAAAQAQVIASTFESTVAATVHPALVAANRNELVQLVVSNLFGQNAPAIAAAESNYEQMWAQDVAAMIGYHGGASAAVAQLSSWEAALQGLPAQASAAITTNPVSSVLSSAAISDPLTGLLGPIEQELTGIFGQVQQQVINVINAPTEFLLGRPLIGTGSSVSLGGAVNGGTATAPLTIVDGTEPVVNASVGSGSPVPLLVDTGSTGLVIPFQDVGGLLGMLQLGLPHGFGIGGYSGGLDYLYATFNAPVNFGGGLVTSSTPVDVELFAWPTSLHALQTNGFSFQSYFAQDGVSGVLGVGPNAGGPGPSIATQALPAPYNQGLLINEVAASPYLQFGGPPTNLGTSIATLTGAPITNLDVKVGNTTYTDVLSMVDSGGVQGTIPSSIIGNAAPGTLVEISTTDGTPLYEYTYAGGPNAYYPTVISSGVMNTGYAPYSLFPIYVDYGADTMTLYPA